MSSVGQIDSSTLANSVYGSSQSKKTNNDYGRTIGDPKLSDEASKYYEELKSKNSDKEFVLVSQDKVDQAEALAAQFANPNKTIVLVDEDKIEKMATDEDTRKKYEDIIANADSKLDELAKSLEKNGLSGSVAGFGMKINDDGTASYFAALKDSSEAQKQRIEQRAQEKKAEKKAADKKAQKDAAEEALEEKRKTDRGEQVGDSEKTGNQGKLTMVRGNTIDELMQNITDTLIGSNQIRTEQEMQVGQNFDMRW